MCYINALDNTFAFQVIVKSGDRQIRAGIIISRCWICLNRFLWFLEQSPNSLIIGKSTLMTSLCLGLSEKVHLEKYTVATF